MSQAPNRIHTYNWKAPLTSYDVFHKMDGKAYLQSILDGHHTESPMAQTMGLTLADVDDGYVVYTVEPTEYHYNPIGSVHGGLAATLFDATLASAIITKLPVGKVCATVELHVHYLRALSAKTGRVRCEAHAIHVGRTLATAEAKLIGENDGKIYGHATTTCVVMPAPQGDISLVQTQDTRTFSWDDPLSIAHDAMQMIGLDFMTSIVESKTPPPPIAMAIGMSGVEKVDAGYARFGTHIGGWQMNTSGAIHGGLIATLCDSALGCAVHTTMPKGMAYTTVELNVSFVRPVTPTVKHLYADATVLHSGNQIATAEAKVIDDGGILYAHATTTCLVFPI
jgi:uncharacterized protein (TIGR00369 family)